MKRRTFIAGLGSTAAWPVVARAQQSNRIRLVGMLVLGDENDPVGKNVVSWFTQALAGLGWAYPHNVRMDLRWWANGTDRLRALAKELVGLEPDIIVTNGTLATVAVQRETRTIPIIFVSAGDP